MTMMSSALIRFTSHRKSRIRSSLFYKELRNLKSKLVGKIRMDEIQYRTFTLFKKITTMKTRMMTWAIQLILI